MSFSVGEMVGPYRIIDQLGQGGMATVYKAYHAALDRYVALKVLHPAFNEDPTFLARFQREARLVARLDHPNIVPIYDYAEHEGRPYLVMKFIEGETLKARLSRGKISGDEVLRIVNAVGSGLQFAHKRGILHRDIKPSNVLISVDGEIYLADFGLARIAQTGESTLTSDMIVGTPQYISPEQALGKKDLDEGTDIYSFGVMLYELTVGKVPFSADTPFSIIHDHIYTPLPMPRKVNPSVSESVERVLLKTLAKERRDRYADVPAMLGAFTQAWQSTPVKETTFAETVIAQPEHHEQDSAPAPATVIKPVPVSLPDSSSLTIDVPAVPGLDEEPKKKALEIGRKKRPWMWIAAGTLSIICCVIGGLAFRNISDDLFTVTPGSAPPTQGPLPTRSTSELSLAQQAVEQKPDDPDLRIRLVIAYMHDGQGDQAEKEFVKVYTLENLDEAFLMRAGTSLAAENAWIMAARMYLRAAEAQGAENLSADLRLALHEATYKAFSIPDATVKIPYESIGAVDRPLMYIAKARFTFYNVNKDQGFSALEDLDLYKPNTQESGLLHGEFLAKSDRPRDARLALEGLLATIDLDEWIRVEAQQIMESLPK